MWRKLAILFIIICHMKVRSQFNECHLDPEETPDTGPIMESKFSWLGALQYIHVKTGKPHYFRVPRAVLVSRQFVITTAVDASEIPPGYALGNIAFADYDRDELECKLTVDMVISGAECDPAILLVPIADVLVHPEYKHFNAKNSVALLKLIKPVKSTFMLPVCLPFSDNLINAQGRQTRQRIIYVDFVVDVPRDFSEEEKEVKKLNLLPAELCTNFDRSLPKNSTGITRDRMMCTTGCGFHSGAPSLVHERTGHWSLVALALGQAPCPDPLRPRRPPRPPVHIMIHPYVAWITAAISSKAIGAFAKDDPFGYAMPRGGIDGLNDIGHYWLGHWYMGGLRCFDRGEDADTMFKFYHEIFSVKGKTDTNNNYISYHLEIYSEPLTVVVCVKVGMPYRYTTPKVYNLHQIMSTVFIPVIKTKAQYRFQVEAWGYNLSSSESHYTYR